MTDVTNTNPNAAVCAQLHTLDARLAEAIDEDSFEASSDARQDFENDVMRRKRRRQACRYRTAPGALAGVAGDVVRGLSPRAGAREPTPELEPRARQAEPCRPELRVHL
jgi:hypothetical protein